MHDKTHVYEDIYKEIDSPTFCLLSCRQMAYTQTNLGKLSAAVLFVCIFATYRWRMKFLGGVINAWFLLVFIYDMTEDNFQGHLRQKRLKKLPENRFFQNSFINITWK